VAFKTFNCAHCGLIGMQPTGAYNRAAKKGHVYCSRACAGLARRLYQSEEEKKANKSAYDAQRRIDLRDKLKAEKAAYYQRTKDPVREAEIRKAKMPRHIEYCRRPEYREWKSQYDKEHRAKKYYGPFWESAMILNEISTEVLSRVDRVEIARQNGTQNKIISRRRDYDRQVGTPQAFRR